MGLFSSDEFDYYAWESENKRANALEFQLEMLETILDKAKTITLSKIDGNYHLDFGGYCCQKDKTLDKVLSKAIKVIDNFRGF